MLAVGASAQDLKAHLNQVALERAGPKVAVVEYAGPGAPSGFSVVKEGAVVRSGALTPLPAFGEWGAKRYWQADFSDLADAGTYHLKVEAPGASAASAPVAVADDALFATTAGALVNYFKFSRHTDPADHKIRVYGQTFRLWKDGKAVGGIQEGFFVPHLNKTRYWWQGESARLASLSYAALVGGRVVDAAPGQPFGVSPDLARMSQASFDWTLGRNPYDMSLLYGFGAKNPPHADSAGEMVKGGISNGITGVPDSDSGRGISWAAGPDEQNWRWIEQWIPHTSWMLLAVAAT